MHSTRKAHPAPQIFIHYWRLTIFLPFSNWSFKISLKAFLLFKSGMCQWRGFPLIFWRLFKCCCHYFTVYVFKSKHYNNSNSSFEETEGLSNKLRKYSFHSILTSAASPLRNIAIAYVLILELPRQEAPSVHRLSSYSSSGYRTN